MITKNKLEQRVTEIKPDRKKQKNMLLCMIILVAVAAVTLLTLILAVRPGQEAASNDSGEETSEVTNGENGTSEGDNIDAGADGNAGAGADGNAGAGADGNAGAGADGNAGAGTGDNPDAKEPDADDESGEIKPLTGDQMSEADSMMMLGGILGGYTAEQPGHTLEIVTCMKNDAENKIECELVDPVYGRELLAALVAEHPEWEWLSRNAEAYGWRSRHNAPWRVVWYNS